MSLISKSLTDVNKSELMEYFLPLIYTAVKQLCDLTVTQIAQAN